MRISDWSSDVCSSDLLKDGRVLRCASTGTSGMGTLSKSEEQHLSDFYEHTGYGSKAIDRAAAERSEEHTSELQSLMRVSYAVFCLKKTKTQKEKHHQKTDQRIQCDTVYVEFTHDLKSIVL